MIHPVQLFICIEIHPRHCVGQSPVQTVVERASKLSSGCAENVHAIARTLEVGRNTCMNIRHHAYGRYEYGGQYAHLVVADLVVVFHAVLSRDKGCVIGCRRIVAPLSGTHQLRQFVLPIRCLYGIVHRIGPAEVVKQRDAVRIGSHNDRIANGLINRVRCHVIAIYLRIEGIDTRCKYETLMVSGNGSNHPSVRRTGFIGTDKGFKHRFSPHLVIVASYDGLSAAAVQIGYHLQHGFSQGRPPGRAFLNKHGGIPSRLQRHRYVAVKKGQLQIADSPSLIGHMETARIGKLSHGQCKHIPATGEIQKGIELLRRHCQGHALLRF